MDLSSEAFITEENILSLNKHALDNLNNPHIALSDLQSAERILFESAPEKFKNRLMLMALTFNNLACYYKRMNQPNVALLYLNQVAKLEYQTLSNPFDIASTQLNLCAINSQLGKHASALENAKRALSLFNQIDENELNSSQITKIVAAYYNAGIEFEFMYDINQAYEYMEKGYELAKKHLDLRHPLVRNIYKSLNELKERRDRFKLLVIERRNVRKIQRMESKSISPAMSIRYEETSKSSTSKMNFASFGQSMVTPKYNPLKLPISMTMRHDRLMKRDISAGLKIYLMEKDPKSKPLPNQ
ncbi:unnamed protein product [Blepharisma stoltei]|uniref:Tetratricopeptide repeat protein n=1 Tax=Blepharisma stoltei TaxID=1481888 RepID=A0AAU9JRW8_9CILI|nr:unnamed protein product [Blepharisma stoltei]